MGSYTLWTTVWRCTRTKFNHYLAPAFGPIDETSYFGLLYDPETGLIGIEDYLVQEPELWRQWLEATGSAEARERANEVERQMNLLGSDYSGESLESIHPVLDERQVLRILNTIPEHVSEYFRTHEFERSSKHVVMDTLETRLIDTFINDEEQGGDVGNFTDADKLELLNLHQDILDGKIRLNDPLIENADVSRLRSHGY